MRDALKGAQAPPEEAGGAQAAIAPLPRVSIQAFCEGPELAALVETIAKDRRMAKAHVKVQMGGGPAAVEAYRGAATPNILILQAPGDQSGLLRDLDLLAEVCDAATKVVVVGRLNDVQLYRELKRRGVSDYLIEPLGALDLIRALSELFAAPGAEPIGRTIAVLGTKGGVGASTIAHNLGWATATSLGVSTVIADLDLGFGTLALGFDQDPPQGIADIVFSPERVDANFVDRLLSKCSDKLSLLAAPAMLDRTYDFSESTFDAALDLLRASTPLAILDVPHAWNAWTKRLATGADEVVIVAAPELASFRNVKNLVAVLKQGRPNDRPPRLVLNGVGMPKRPELPVAEFGRVLGLEPDAVIPFDAALFGTALNNGQMILEVQPSGKAAEAIGGLAAILAGRGPAKRARGNPLGALMHMFTRPKG